MALIFLYILEGKHAVLIVHRICSLLGTIFGFVGSEILSKMDVLRELKRNDIEGNFTTMNSMVEYERTHELLYKSNYVSGSRTLLRLHRGFGKLLGINQENVYLLKTFFFFFSVLFIILDESKPTKYG